jgi:hypothetical protein
MSLSAVIGFLITWTIIGALLFSLFVLFVFRSGVVYTARNEDGLLKEKIPLTGYLSSAGFLVLIVIFLLGANNFGLYRSGYELTFGSLFALNLGLYLLLFLYDTLIIDGLVLGYWRPDFLQLPEAMGAESMGTHMRKSILPGILFGLVIALICSAISFYFFWRS